MQRLMIDGGRELSGELAIQGAKNSVLPIMAASLLAEGESVIENCPLLLDTLTAQEILTALGCKIKRQSHAICIETTNLNACEIPDLLMRRMRSSVVFLGAILGRFKKARISFPGGCELGPRPIDLHLSGLSKMGAQIREEFGYLVCDCPKGLTGTDITLSFPSVGATENIMLAAVRAKGVTTIINSAKEPEIEDLQCFLNKMGARISGAGSGIVRIDGIDRLAPASHRVIPDRIATATYLLCAAATGGDVSVTHCKPEHLWSVLTLLDEAGATVRCGTDSVRIKAGRPLFSVGTVRTMPHPGFPTDAQAPLMALMSTAKGNTVFIETIFTNRFKHVSELSRMGAKIRTDGRMAVVEGVDRLTGAIVEAGDLRGGACLVIAGLGAEGRTVVENVAHIDRGYERIEEKLSALGADIRRE